MKLEKMRAYMTRRSLGYFLRHPIGAVKFITKGEEYLTFTSSILGIPLDRILLHSSSGSLRNLMGVTRRSIIPTNQDAPLYFESSMSLYLIARVLKPKTIVETGVSAGRSSAFILQALDDNGDGILYSIDPDRNSGYAIPQGLKRRWRLLVGKSCDLLPDLAVSLGQIDVFVHDSLHTYENMMFEYQEAWSFINEGGVLLSDDVDWNEAFRDFHKQVDRNPIYLTKRFAGIRK